MPGEIQGGRKAQGAPAHLANSAPHSGTRSRNRFRLGEWKIGTFLTACFAAIVLLMMVGDMIVMLQLDRVETRATQFYQADQKSLAILHVYLDVVTFRDTLTSLAHDQNPQNFASRATTLRDNFLRDVTHAQQTLSAAPDASQDPTILIRLETVRAALPSQVDAFLELGKVEDWQAVRFRLAGQMQPLIALSSSLVADVEQEVAQERAQALESIQRTRRQLYLVLPVTALLILVMAAMLGWYATRRISRPLAQLDAGAQALARGEFDCEVELGGNDELSDLARAFNYAAQQLQKLYDDIKRSEAYLADSKTRLEEAQRIAHVGHWIWDLGNDGLTWSDETYRIFGLRPRERPMNVAAMQDMIHPEDRKVLFPATHAARSGGHPDIEFRIVRPNGEVRTIHSQGAITRDVPGQPRQRFGAVQDITDRKRAEEELRRSQVYLSEGQRLAHMGSWAFNPAGFFDYWSEELFRIYGLDAQKGAPTLEQYLATVHPQDRDFMANTIKRMHAEHSSCDVKKRIVCPGGELRYIRCVGIPVVEGEVLKGFLGTAIDITEQELLTQELERRQAHLTEAQRLTHTGSWIWHLADRSAAHLSEEWYRIYGFDPAEGAPTWEEYFERIHPEDRLKYRNAIEHAIAEKADYEREFRILLPDGIVKWIQTVGHPVLSGTGDLEQFVGSSTDITERKSAEQEHGKLRQLEAELAHINRVSVLGEMAASLAHEIKQPIAAAITSANTCVEWLAHEPPNLDRARAAAARIDKYGNRAAEIIDRIRSFYRKTAPQREMVDVNGIIDEILTLLKGEASRLSVTVGTDLSAELPKIMVDRVQLQQVFMNLMLNAIEAMNESGGELTVKSELQDGQLQFSVSDSGSGLPGGNVDQIFSAFFTTKPQGSGMGLAISRSIVESHGGQLWANANSGRGATFYFTLPI
jgi:PAS domain S-box-containing protein